MPCRTGLESIEDLNFYNETSKANKSDILWFRTPLAALLCETIKKLEQANLFDQLSEELKEWWLEHKRRDNNEPISEEDLRNLLLKWYSRIPDHI